MKLRKRYDPVLQPLVDALPTDLLRYIALLHALQPKHADTVYRAGYALRGTRHVFKYKR